MIIQTTVIIARPKLSVQFSFSASEAFDGTYPTNVVVTSTGSCTYIPPGIFKSTCLIDITWFPFDDQDCEMKFGSWTYNGFKVIIATVAFSVSISTQCLQYHRERGTQLIFSSIQLMTLFLQNLLKTIHHSLNACPWCQKSHYRNLSYELDTIQWLWLQQLKKVSKHMLLFWEKSSN